MRTRTSAPRRSLRAVVAAPVLALFIILAALMSPLVPAPAAEAAQGPETNVGARWVAWDVRTPGGALVGGGTFQLQRAEMTWMGWSDYSTIAALGDCSAPTCAATGDRDPDAGEFQVTSGVLQNGWTSTYRYRIVPVASPAGHEWTSTVPKDVTLGASGSVESDPFRVVERTALSCEAGTFYSLLADGTVRRVTASGTGATITGVGGWDAASSGVNALGIGAGGTSAYALVRSTDNGARDVASILRFTMDAGWTAVPNSAYRTGSAGTSAVLVAGAVSVATGDYYFGGPTQISSNNWGFRLHRFDVSVNRSSFVGTIEMAASSNFNGDLAFDAAGNLVLLQTPLSGDPAASRRFTIAPAMLTGASGGTIAAAAQNAPVALEGNGIAFDADGSLFVADGSTVRRYAPNWSTATSTVVSTGLGSSVDLASCAEPATVSVNTVTPNAASGDRIVVQMRQGSTVLGSGESISGVRVPTSTSYTVSQSITSSAGADASLNYSSTWACTGGGQVVRVDAKTFTLTTPPNAGANVVCTFTNISLVTSITVRKDVRDANGTIAPRNNWTVGATVVSGATQIGAATTSNQQTALDGTAGWRIRHTGAATNAQITITEKQQVGFEFTSGYCDVTPFGNAAVRTPITKQGDDAIALELTAAPGSTVNCVFTNQVKPTTLTLVKEVTFGTAPTNLFTLRAAAPSGAPVGTLAGPTGMSGTPAATNVRITPGIAYRLSESGGPATYAQVGSWTCVNQIGTAVAVTAAGDVTAAQGDSVTCRVRNATAALVLLERIEGSSTLTPSQFSLTATPADLNTLQPTTVPGAAQVTSENTIQVRPGHGYSLASASSAAHIGLRLECYTGPGSTSCLNGATAPTAAQLADQSNWRTQTATTASVAPGTTAYYRFVATSPTPFSLPMTGGLGTDQIHLLGGGLAVLALLTGLGLLLHRRRRAA